MAGGCSRGRDMNILLNGIFMQSQVEAPICRLSGSPPRRGQPKVHSTSATTAQGHSFLGGRSRSGGQKDANRRLLSKSHETFRAGSAAGAQTRSRVCGDSCIRVTFRTREHINPVTSTCLTKFETQRVPAGGDWRSSGGAAPGLLSLSQRLQRRRG